MLNYYVSIINDLLEKPRYELEKKYYYSKNKMIKKVLRKYDETLLEKYKYIEKMIKEELSEME